MRFRAHINANTTIYFTPQNIVNPNVLFSIREPLIPWLLAGNIPDQAIGATDSDGEVLYFGDVVKVELEKNAFFSGKSEEGRFIGLIVWDEFAVKVRLPRNEYICFSWLEFSFIKKLGSRHTKEGKEILKKAGLEKA